MSPRRETAPQKVNFGQEHYDDSLAPPKIETANFKRQVHDDDDQTPIKSEISAFDRSKAGDSSFMREDDTTRHLDVTDGLDRDSQFGQSALLDFSYQEQRKQKLLKKNAGRQE